MNIRLRLLAAGVAALTGTLAQAEPHLRPGLWEETVTVKSDNAQANAAMEQMKARMAAMTPEQREAMEKMMASHGVGMGAGSGPANAIRVCVTKEQADRGFKPEDNGHCTRSNVSTSGNTTSFDFACKSERSSVTGHGSFTARGDTAFTASTTADNVSPKMTMHIQSDIAGRFVSTDCGDVKPMPTSPTK
jgi:hypothetical protein